MKECNDFGSTEVAEVTGGRETQRTFKGLLRSGVRNEEQGRPTPKRTKEGKKGLRKSRLALPLWAFFSDPASGRTSGNWRNIEKQVPRPSEEGHGARSGESDVGR